MGNAVTERVRLGEGDGLPVPCRPVLVVDGDLARRLTDLLTEEGRNIASAETPEEALAMMASETVDCVLLDQTVAELSAAALEERTLVGKELDALAYAISHDLRAPLRSVEGFSVALMEHVGDTLDPKAKDYLGRVRAGALRMAAMIDGLLALSRAGRLALDRVPADLSDIAGMVVAELAKAEPTRDVAVTIKQRLVAEVDRGLMTRVFEHLIGNSWKFTSRVARATIEIGATRTLDTTTYFVRDNGEGFDMAHAEKLFRPFQRLHSATDFPGLGIGLAMVARIVARHGGRVSAESAPGVGTTVRFTLPAPRSGGLA
jgi:light-regulated signal transduction histidine kinase (bacteriophytochrome)